MQYFLLYEINITNWIISLKIDKIIDILLNINYILSIFNIYLIKIITKYSLKKTLICIQFKINKIKNKISIIIARG